MSLSVHNVYVVVLVSTPARLCRVIVISIAPYVYKSLNGVKLIANEERKGRIRALVNFHEICRRKSVKTQAS